MRRGRGPRGRPRAAPPCPGRSSGGRPPPREPRGQRRRSARPTRRLPSGREAAPPSRSLGRRRYTLNTSTAARGEVRRQAPDRRRHLRLQPLRASLSLLLASWPSRRRRGDLWCRLVRASALGWHLARASEPTRARWPAPTRPRLRETASGNHLQAGRACCRGAHRSRSRPSSARPPCPSRPYASPCP